MDTAPFDTGLETGSPPYRIVDAAAPGPAVVVCDHASNAVPDWIAGGSLGLGPADMVRHIAWDVGAAGVAERLAPRLSAPAIYGAWSRLVVDLNRGGDDPTLVMELYDGSIVPGNRGIPPAEIAERRARLHAPYHAALDDLLRGMEARGTDPHLVSVHSFAPQLRGHPPRPWHVGVLYAHETRLALPLLAALRAEGDLEVGENVPYSGALDGDCMHRHAIVPGRPYVLIEIRNDLIRDAAGQAAWADRLARLLSPLIPVA